jgi:hypothetical protein
MKRYKVALATAVFSGLTPVGAAATPTVDRDGGAADTTPDALGCLNPSPCGARG